MQKKSKGRKNYVLQAKEVADIANVSESYVKQVRTAETSGVAIKSEKAKTIQAIDVSAQQNKSILIQELKKIVNL